MHKSGENSLTCARFKYADPKERKQNNQHPQLDQSRPNRAHESSEGTVASRSHFSF